MGDCTRLTLDVTLKDDTPEDARLWLENLIFFYIDDFQKSNRPPHPFWRDWRASFIGSGPAEFRFPKLVVNCEFKNYTSTIEKFLDWLAPFVQSVEVGIYSFVYYGDDTLSITEVEGHQRFVRHCAGYDDGDAFCPKEDYIIERFKDV